MGRTKPFVKIHLSIADHAKTSGVWADVRKRGMLAELIRKSGEKYAAKRSDRVPLKATDRMEIAGSVDAAEADELVESLCREMRYAVRKYPNRWEVHVRNFSKKQGFEKPDLDKNSTGSGQELDHFLGSETPKLRSTESPNAETPNAERKPAPAALPPSPGQLTARTRKPETFEGEALRKIETWATKHGHAPELLQEALERFQEWEPQSGKAIRTWAQWVGAFTKIARGLATEKPASGVRSIVRESPAEGRVRRTIEAAQRVEARMAADPFRIVAASAGGANP